MITQTINLNEIKKTYDSISNKIKKRIIICAGTACVANGALKIRDELVKKLEEKNIDAVIELKKEDEKDNNIYVSKSGCQGFCQMGPLVTILPEDILYTKVKITDIDEIIEKTILNDEIIERLLYQNPATKERQKNKNEIDFYKKQKRFILKNCGVIDPEDINEYIAIGGYSALEKIKDLPGEKICEEILNSGLRGRGGSGFRTGIKWDLTRKEKSDKKYVVCNGDEGDPGAFMDRSIMEGNPHSVIEGMLIAAKACGANEGYVYVRAEYPLAVKRMKKAVVDAEKLGILNEDFTLHVMEGAGAFVCGEETALLSSVEGKRGMPTPKPPYPASCGLWGKPTVINNVETIATIPLIITIGADEFSKIGHENSKGTKSFAITGHVANTGLIEVPLGTTAREIVFEIAGGVTDKTGKVDNNNFKAVQIGGPSGACLTEENLDLPLEFDSLRKIGAMVGSGGLVIVNKDTCMVNFAKYFMEFTQNESCGKCVLCREGTKQMLNILDDITKGKATMDDLDNLLELASAVAKGSLCGLGKSAPNPVLSTIKYFKDEYIAHIVDKRCPTADCKDLATIIIDAELCKGCMLCAKKCPAGAISGEKLKPHTIDTEKCTKCEICISTCKFGAIYKA